MYARFCSIINSYENSGSLEVRQRATLYSTEYLQQSELVILVDLSTTYYMKELPTVYPLDELAKNS